MRIRFFVVASDYLEISNAGETFWHRLGVKVEKVFDAKTALEQGGLDFTIEKTKIA